MAESPIPVVDWTRLETDRSGFLADVRFALGEVGFMVLANAPGFAPRVQARTFQEAHRFFDAPAEIRDGASIASTPFMRGYDPIVQSPSQLIETYQYGPDQPPAVADHKDPDEPIWKRMLIGPQTWPDERVLPEFRATIEALGSSYTRLHHELGELICESLGAPPGTYGSLFDKEHPLPLAFIGRSYSLAHVQRGGLATNRRPVKSGDEGVAQMTENLAQGAGGHVDITPFMALLTMDAPGLQVLAKGGHWVDMPLIPGAVCVNAGSTLQHLSGGRMVATMHRVNTLLIPDGTTRISAPFFLMPRFDAQLDPFVDPAAAGTDGDEEEDDTRTDYINQDRGLAAAFNRMSLFRSCTRAFWSEEYEAVKEEQWRLAAQENLAVTRKIERAATPARQQEARL